MDQPQQSVPLMIVPIGISKHIAKSLVGISHKISSLSPGLEYDLEQTDLKLNKEEYIANTIVTCASVFVIFALLIVLLAFRVRHLDLTKSILLGAAIGFGAFILFFILLLRYPKIIAGKKAEQIDRHLLFALKDLLLQISSGVSLYNAIINVATSGYGIVSDEFKKVAKNVKTGMALNTALERLAVESSSEYMRRTIWQIVNTLKAGASLKGALQSIISELAVTQHTKIKNYSQELNLWSLIYMLFAVAIPTIGSTMLVILSSFAGIGVSKGTFIVFIVFCFFIQIALIGFVKTRRPAVNF